MRILLIIDGLPYPLTTGRLRHYHFLRELAARHDIVLLALSDGRSSPDDLAALGQYATAVEVVPPVPGRGPAPLRAARRAIAAFGGPLGGATGALRDRLRQLLATGSFDAAVLTGKRSYYVAADAASVPTVADLCDAASARTWSRLRYSTARERPAVLAQWAELRLLERRAMRSADHVVFATPRDRDALIDSPSRGVSVIPNGIDTAFWTRRTGARPPDAITFTGAMDYPPNEDAALYLIREILPLVRARRPAVCLSIVGRDPTPALIRAGEGQGVTVTGFVDDVRPHLEAATVFAAPIRFGAGIQNKVLEAMSMELPVVASPSAADGLRIDPGGDPPIVVAADATGFADRLVDALEAGARDPRPDAAGRAYVERHFVWERCAAALEDSIMAAIARHSTGAR